jgi:hypothetical protein
MGIFKEQKLLVEGGKILQHVFAFCLSTSEDCLCVGNSVLKLGLDLQWRAVTGRRAIMCFCLEVLAKGWLLAIPVRGGHWFT